MELARYVEDELAEERMLGHDSGRLQRGNGSDYPGDPEVEVPVTAVQTSPLEVTLGGTPTTAIAVSSPAQDAPAPGIVVIHENKGLVPYVENTARRLATHGFVALAPDLLAPQGGTAAFETLEAATAGLKARNPEDLLADLQATVTALAADPRVDGQRLAVIGFCFGGGLAWRLVAADDRLRAGVPFYGPPPPDDEFAAISASVLAIYGETDERITSTLPTTRAAMEAHGKPLETLVLPGAGHAFHNDTNPDRYHADAARAAWDRAVAFLSQSLDHSAAG